MTSTEMIESLIDRGVLLLHNNQYKLSPIAELMLQEKSLGFDDVAIKQKKNVCTSRLDVSTVSEIIRGVTVTIPLIAANMSTVTSADFCISLYEHGGFAFLHRAMPEAEYKQEVTAIAKKVAWVCASIGVGNGQCDLVKELIRSGANIICVDIAHGYSDPVIDMAKFIKSFSVNTKVVVGNTVNPDMIEDVVGCCDAIKVGIAQGCACETKDTAGCTERQLSAVLKFKAASKKYGIPVISDGGIRKPADFVKAIGAGAAGVMAGSIFAACPDSAAELVDGKHKLYAGMASRHVQNHWKGGVKNGTCTEGKVVLLPVGESSEKLLERYQGALRSGITYAGYNNVDDFRDGCEFIKL